MAILKAMAKMARRVGNTNPRDLMAKVKERRPKVRVKAKASTKATKAKVRGTFMSSTNSMTTGKSQQSRHGMTTVGVGKKVHGGPRRSTIFKKLIGKEAIGIKAAQHGMKAADSIQIGKHNPGMELASQPYKQKVRPPQQMVVSHPLISRLQASAIMISIEYRLD